MRLIVGLLIFVMLPGMAAASVRCFPEKIKSLQVAKGGDVHYTTVTGVKRKLTHLSQYEAKAMFDLLYGSINTLQIIQVVYPDGYNCKTPDLDVIAESVVLQDPRVNP